MSIGGVRLLLTAVAICLRAIRYALDTKVIAAAAADAAGKTRSIDLQERLSLSILPCDKHFEQQLY